MNLAFGFGWSFIQHRSKISSENNSTYWSLLSLACPCWHLSGNYFPWTTYLNIVFQRVKHWYLKLSVKQLKMQNGRNFIGKRDGWVGNTCVADGRQHRDLGSLPWKGRHSLLKFLLSSTHSLFSADFFVPSRSSLKQKGSTEVPLSALGWMSLSASQEVQL